MTKSRLTALFGLLLFFISFSFSHAIAIDTVFNETFNSANFKIGNFNIPFCNVVSLNNLTSIASFNGDNGLYYLCHYNVSTSTIRNSSIYSSSKWNKYGNQLNLEYNQTAPSSASEPKYLIYYPFVNETYIDNNTYIEILANNSYSNPLIKNIMNIVFIDDNNNCVSDSYTAISNINNTFCKGTLKFFNELSLDNCAGCDSQINSSTYRYKRNLTNLDRRYKVKGFAISVIPSNVIDNVNGNVSIDNFFISNFKSGENILPFADVSIIGNLGENLGCLVSGSGNKSVFNVLTNFSDLENDSVICGIKDQFSYIDYSQTNRFQTIECNNGFLGLFKTCGAAPDYTQLKNFFTISNESCAIMPGLIHDTTSGIIQNDSDTYAFYQNSNPNNCVDDTIYNDLGHSYDSFFYSLFVEKGFENNHVLLVSFYTPSFIEVSRLRINRTNASYYIEVYNETSNTYFSPSTIDFNHRIVIGYPGITHNGLIDSISILTNETTSATFLLLNKTRTDFSPIRFIGLKFLDRDTDKDGIVYSLIQVNGQVKNNIPVFSPCETNITLNFSLTGVYTYGFSFSDSIHGNTSWITFNKTFSVVECSEVPPGIKNFGSITKNLFQNAICPMFHSFFIFPESQLRRVFNNQKFKIDSCLFLRFAIYILLFIAIIRLNEEKFGGDTPFLDKYFPGYKLEIFIFFMGIGMLLLGIFLFDMSGTEKVLTSLFISFAISKSVTKNILSENPEVSQPVIYVNKGV